MGKDLEVSLLGEYSREGDVGRQLLPYSLTDAFI